MTASRRQVYGEAPLLRIRDATVRKGEGAGRTILDRLNLEIHHQEHTAILGPNGSGKSSLIKLITHDYHPLARAEGEPVLEIFGRARWDVFALRTSMGIVSMDLQREFIDAVTAASLRGLDVTLSGFFATRSLQSYHNVTEVMRDRAREALALMGAAHLGGKLIREMSTGEIRRVLIARALVADPPALLLDEPTTGLDVVARHCFLETIRRLAHHGKSIVLVTHHIEEIVPEISRVVLLREGRVFYDGPTNAALTAANLSTAYGAPMQVELTPTGYYHASIAARPAGR